MKPLDPRLVRHGPVLRRYLAVTVGLTALDTAALLTAVVVLGSVLAGVVDGDWGAPRVARSAAALVAVVALRALIGAFATRSGQRAASATTAQLRRALLRRVIDDGVHRAPGEVGLLATRGVEALEPYVREYLPALVAGVLVPPVLLAGAFLTDPTSGWLLLVTLPLVPVFMVLVGKASAERSARSWTTLERLAAHLADVITGLPTLKLFGRQHAQADVVERLGERSRVATMRTLRVAFLSALVLELLASLSVALVAVSVGLRLVDGSVALRTAFVVLIIAPECFAPLRRLGASYHAATEGIAAADEIVDVLEAPVPVGGVAPVPDAPVIVCSGVSLTRPGRAGAAPADVSFSVGPGEVVALVGENGAGKSTVLAVLRGRVVPDSGAITVGGRPLADLDRAAWADSISWMPQRPALGDSTVREVLSLAARGAGAAMSEAAAALGIDTLLDRRARSLSAGERQRVALARVILRVELGGARIALLDEPTANLDPSTEALVVRVLHRLARAGATTVVVTHRSAVAAAADRVVTVGSQRPAIDPVHGATVVGPVRASTAVPQTGGAEPATGSGPAARSPRRWLWDAAGPVRTRLGRAVLLATLAAVTGMGLTGAAAWLLARAAEHPPVLELGVAVVLVRALALTKAVLRYLERLASHDAALRLVARMRTRVYRCLAVIAPGGIARARRGDLLARVVGDLDQVQDLLVRSVLPPFVAWGAGIVVVVFGWALLPVAGVAVAIALLAGAALVPWLAARISRSAAAVAATARAALTAEAVDVAETAEELAAFGAAEERLDAVGIEATRLASATNRAALGDAFGDAGERVVVGLLTAALLVFGAAAVRSGGLDPRWLSALVLVGWSLVEVLAPLPLAAHRSSALVTTVGRLSEVVDGVDPVPDPEAPALAPTGPIGVRARGLAIRWPDAPRPVVHDLDLDLAPGSRTVLTGPSGAGKSTIAAALVRFLPVSAGRIELNGVPIDRLRGDDVRRLVGWCAQDVHLFDTTIADNLRIAKPDATEAELTAVCRSVGLEGWVAGLPDGLETRVGVAGSDLSGGEAQRLALARELLADRPVIVLDEPTANVDPDTAERLMRDLLGAAAGRTLLVISHDVAGIEAADQVVSVGSPSTSVVALAT